MANVVNIDDTITVQAGTPINKVLTAPNSVSGYGVSKNDIGEGGTATSVTATLDWGQTGSGYTLKYQPFVTFTGVPPATAGTYHKTYNCQTKNGNTVVNDFQFDLTIVVTGSTSTYKITATAGAHGTIDPAGEVTVNEGDTPKFTFTPDTNYFVNSVKVDNVEQGNIMEYTFPPVTDNHKISVTFGRSETITASENITVGVGKSVNKTVQIGTTYVLYGLTKVDDGEGGTASNVHGTLNWHEGGMYCQPSATFTGTAPTTAGSYTKTYTCRLTTNGITVRTFIMTLNLTVLNEYDITGTVKNNVGGTISPTSDTVLEGATKTFTFTPSTGYRIKTVKKNGTTVTVTGNTYTTPAIHEDTTVEVEYEKIPYTVTPRAGTGGTISPDEELTMYFDSTQIFTFTPNTGYAVVSVTKGTVVEPWTSNTYPLTGVTADMEFSVQFEKITFKITATAGAHGTIDPAGEVDVEYGDTPTFTFTPDEGYYVQEVLVDGEPVEPTE